MTAPVKSVRFTPVQGVLRLGEELARRLGLMHFWEGDEGLRGVVKAKLSEMGVPQDGVELTPRELAEHSGFIKKRKRLKT
jgi:hypothetical protein